MFHQCVLPSVALGKASLKFVVEAVYLWHIISSNLKADYDVYKQVKKNLTRLDMSDTQIS